MTLVAGGGADGHADDPCGDRGGETGGACEGAHRGSSELRLLNLSTGHPRRPAIFSSCFPGFVGRG